VNNLEGLVIFIFEKGLFYIKCNHNTMYVFLWGKDIASIAYLLVCLQVQGYLRKYYARLSRLQGEEVLIYGTATKPDKVLGISFH